MSRGWRKPLAFALGLAGATFPGLGAGVAPASAEPSPKALQRAIGRVVSSRDLASASWGIEVRSLKTGRVLYALDPERSYRPASTLKLVTTAAALDAFGPDARVRTTVETSGRLDGLGRILGDVYLVGRGDTSLGGRFSPERPAAAFEALADALVAAGVRRIEGRLIGHEGAFVGERRGHDWTWEDLVWGYGAQVSALSFADNVVELALSPGERAGDPVVLDLWPASGLEVVADVVTAEAGSVQDVRLEAASGSGAIRLSGLLPLGGRWSGRLAVPDPARHAAGIFASLLASRGIRVAGAIETSRAPLPASSRVLASHEGAPLAQLIRAVNKDSLNLQAEALLRLVGSRMKGEGSFERGREAVFEAMARLGVPTAGWVLSDGSGLARTNLLTPRGLAMLLVAMDRHAHSSAFRDSLPVAGLDGTLSARLLGPHVCQRVHAKTGSMALANALAGYATTGDGDRVAFAVLLNNHATGNREAQAAIDRLVEAIVGRARHRD